MYRFTKQQRLLTKQEYDYVFEKSQRVVTSDFVLLYRKNECGFARLGLAISKKSVNKAHHRNKIKRLLRETFRQQPNLKAIDIVVLARSSIHCDDFSKMHTTLSNAWDSLLT
ncbi:MAG: ribonuclease P protein component [Legionella sp. 21-45-4]|nr:MAG: ribonuclease P protein component [Legionella sp. 21-45-4]